jgi:Resolvase, N terminal domain
MCNQQGDLSEGGRWALVDEFTEIESGKRNDRPELQKAIAACKKQKARLVIAKLDRLSRKSLLSQLSPVLPPRPAFGHIGPLCRSAGISSLDARIFSGIRASLAFPRIGSAVFRRRGHSARIQKGRHLRSSLRWPGPVLTAARKDRQHFRLIASTSIRI